MTIQKKVCILISVFLLISFHAIVAGAGDDRFEKAKKYLDKGINTYNEQLLQDAKKIFIQLSRDNPSDYEYAHFVASAYLGLCDLKNFEIEQSAVKKVKKALKAKRVAIAEEGIPFADKSIELNNNYTKMYRVKGEHILKKI